MILIKDGDLSAAELREVLDYDHKTGVFTWKVRRGKGRVLPGQVAGCTHSRRGAVDCIIGYNGKLYQAHRLAWLHFYGQWPKGVLDHINGDRSDNSIENLRECSQRQNLANVGLRANNTSGAKGVYFDKARDKWAARIRKDGRKIMLGRFETKEEAANAYRQAAVREYGEFARVP